MHIKSIKCLQICIYTISFITITSSTTHTTASISVDENLLIGGMFPVDYIDCFAPKTHYDDNGRLESFTIQSYKYSYWSRNNNGEYDILSPTLLNVSDTWYPLIREFSVKNTAFIIMDPWIDMPH